MEKDDPRSSPSPPSTPSVCSPISSVSSVPSTGKNVCASCGLEILDRYLLKVSASWNGRATNPLNLLLISTHSVVLLTQHFKAVSVSAIIEKLHCWTTCLYHALRCQYLHQFLTRVQSRAEKLNKRVCFAGSVCYLTVMIMSSLSICYLFI